MDFQVPSNRRTLINIIANIVGWGWPIGLTLVATPYIVHTLGEDAYGVIALITVVVGYFAALDLGLNVAGIKYIAEYVARGQPEIVRKILATNLALFTILGALGALIIWLLAGPLSEQIFRIPRYLVSTSTLAFQLAAFGFLLSMIVGVLSSVAPALQRYDVSNAVAIGTGTLSVASTVLLAYLRYGIVEITFASACVSLLSLIAYSLIAKRLLPSISLLPHFDHQIFRMLLSFGGFALLNRLLSLLLLQVDRTLVGIWLGTAAVTIYVVPMGLARRLQELIGQLDSVLLPMTSALDGVGKHTALQHLYMRGTSLSFIASTGLAVVLLSYRGTLLSLWMGAEFAQKAEWVLGLLVISYYILSMSAVASYLVHGLGRPQIDTAFALLTTLLNIGGCILLIPPYGVNGAAAARAISVAIPLFPYLWYVERNVLRQPPLRTWIRVCAKPFLIGALLYLVSTIWLQQRAHNIASLLGLMIFSLGVYVALVFITGGFVEEDKLTIIRSLRSIPGVRRLARTQPTP